MSDTYAKYLSFIDVLYDAVVELSVGLRFEKGDLWQRNLVLLYLTQVEFFTAIRIMIVNNCSAGIYPLLRSLMEANVDFINLANDKEYVKKLLAAQLFEQIGVMECSKRGNPFLEGISDSPAFDDEYLKVKQKLAELKADGYNPVKIKDKFDVAQMMPVYWSVYMTLCSETHNNINALNNRHINLSSDNKNYKIELFAPIDFDKLAPYLDSLCGIIVSATESIHSILKSDSIGKATELRNKFQRIRG